MPVLPPDPDVLLSYFEAGGKPKSEWGVGLEYENVGVFEQTGEAIPYFGERSVEAILDGLAERFGWDRQMEDEHIIGLRRGRCAISLEPGGQVELSGKVNPDLCGTLKEISEYLQQLSQISRDLGIAWLGLGIQPKTTVEDIEWVPKHRYQIMSRYLGRKGKLSHHMMKQTAGVQGNFDYSNEEDAARKLRVAMKLTSVITGIYANSAISEGSANGFMSRRARIWLDTDPDRCGLVEEFLSPETSIRDYLEYALDVPMLFIVRNDSWVSIEGACTFRQFLMNGFRGHPATLGDWELHLTTLFPEVRLKDHLEVRSMDNNLFPLAISGIALWKGILYDEEALASAEALMANRSFADHLTLHKAITAQGLAAEHSGRPVLEIARELYGIAEEGLVRQETEDCEELQFLRPLEILLFSDNCPPAAKVLRLWEDEWRHDMDRLIQFTRQERAVEQSL